MMGDLLDKTNWQKKFQNDLMEYQKDKDARSVQRETAAAQCEEKLTDRFMANDCKLRECDGGFTPHKPRAG